MPYPPLQDNFKYPIVPAKWNKQPDPKELDTITEAEANTWLLCRMEHWAIRDYGDEKLWEVFWEDFEGWKKETFLQANKDIRRDFRNHLREWGVYIAKEGTQIAQVLEDVLQEKEPAKWTEKEFQRQIKTKKCYSVGLQRLLERAGIQLPKYQALIVQNRWKPSPANTTLSGTANTTLPSTANTIPPSTADSTTPPSIATPARTANLQLPLFQAQNTP